MNPPKKITTTPTPPPPPNYHFPQPCKIPSFLFANILQAIWYLLAKNLQIYFKIPKFSSQILPVFSCHSSVFQQYITVSFFYFLGPELQFISSNAIILAINSNLIQSPYFYVTILLDSCEWYGIPSHFLIIHPTLSLSIQHELEKGVRGKNTCH